MGCRETPAEEGRMRSRHLVPELLLLSLAACATTTASGTTFGPGERRGQVVWIGETIERQQGDPAGGAAVGAIIGGLLGNAITGRPGGTLFGAVGGAAVGAAASQGAIERRTCEVAVRFDDGSGQYFLFRDYCPFRVGDAVSWTVRGLERTDGPLPEEGCPSSPPPPPPYPPPAAAPPSYPAPPPPPPAMPPPPPPPGEWPAW